MNQTFILTIISDDKPGIVEKIADVIKQHDGNWLESKLSYLAGKFAGIVEFQIEETKADTVQQALKKLSDKGMTIVVEAANAAIQSALPTHRFSVVGNDRPGIVREVAQAIAMKNVNVIELNSKCSSAPHVGTPLFEAWGKIQIPSEADIDALESHLDTLCEQLAVDIQIEPL